MLNPCSLPSGRKGTIEVQICQIAIGDGWLQLQGAQESRTTAGACGPVAQRAEQGTLAPEEGEGDRYGSRVRFDKACKLWYKSATRERGNGSVEPGSRYAHTIF